MMKAQIVRSLFLCASFSAAHAQAPAPSGGGPEPAKTYSDATLASHTIYRPQQLKEGKSYPVVLWGNGSCVNSNFNYREFLADVASHGIIVLALGPYRDSPAPRQARSTDPTQWPPNETTPEQMLAALDWATAQNTTAGSELQNHVDVSRVAAMGHSCGGLQALAVSSDSRITTTVVLNSGIFPEGDPYNARFGITRAQLQKLHNTVGYFIGGETDIAYPNAELDWNELQQGEVPVLNANLDVGHGATYDMPQGGPFARLPLAWLQWQLQGDATARELLLAQPCGVCGDGEGQWRVKLHNLP